MERHTRKPGTLAATLGLLLLATSLPRPSAAANFITDPILVQEIEIDPLQPIAGSGYWIRNACANGLDGPCLYLPAGAWARYTFTVDGHGSRGVDYISALIRGQSWSYSCPWRLVGPGTDQTSGYCPGSPDAPADTGSWWFDDKYAQGTYTLEIRCELNCNNYIWIGDLTIQTWYYDLRLGLRETDHEYFPEPGQIPTSPTFDFTRACISVWLEGSFWYNAFSYRIDWGDGNSETGSSTLEPQWYGHKPYWGSVFCHEYEFPLNAYQVCAAATDSVPRVVDSCTTISGGINAEEFANDGVAYVTGTAT